MIRDVVLLFYSDLKKYTFSLIIKKIETNQINY